MMPRCSGWKTAEQLHDNPPYPDIPIVITTAKDDENSQWHGWNLGTSSHLAKPCNSHHLPEELDRVLCPGV